MSQRDCSPSDEQQLENRPLTPQQKRRRRRAATIEEILAIAREMMQADGVAALRFNALARRMGMRPPSLYTYFPSKDAIYDTLFRRGFEAFGRMHEARRARRLPLRDNLLCVVEDYLAFAQENPDLFQLMFQRPVPHFEPSDESMAVSLGILEQARVEARQMLDDDTLHFDLPVEEAGDLFIAMTHGLTELHLANNPTLPVGEGRFGKLAAQAVDLFLAAWDYRPAPAATPDEPSTGSCA